MIGANQLIVYIVVTALTIPRELVFFLVPNPLKLMFGAKID